MSSPAVTLDMSTAQPIQQQPVTLDMSTAQPIGQEQEPDYLSKTEDLIHGVSKDVGSMLSGVGEMVTAPAKHLKNAITSLSQGDYHGAASSFIDSLKASDPATEIANQQLQSSKQAGERMIEAAKKGDKLAVMQHAAGVLPGASQVDAAMTAYQENPTTENLAHIISTAVPLLIPGALKAGGKLAGGAEAAEPGIFQKIAKGEKVAQPGAQAAVRSAIPEASEGPLVEGHTTALDKHLSSLAENERTAYKKMDAVAEFDVKAEKAQLKNDQYKLKQLGNTEADVAQRAKLTESINDSTDRISQAEAKMKEAGINPKEADAIHQQKMAGQDFKKSLVKNTRPTDGSVNVKGLLKDGQQLRFSKYGDRLEQFFGSKEAADNYMAELQKADQLGVHALKARKVALWAAGLTGLTGVEAAKHLLF
jgi:hypothetical protein